MVAVPARMPTARSAAGPPTTMASFLAVSSPAGSGATTCSARIFARPSRNSVRTTPMRRSAAPETAGRSRWSRMNSRSAIVNRLARIAGELLDEEDRVLRVGRIEGVDAGQRDQAEQVADRELDRPSQGSRPVEGGEGGEVERQRGGGRAPDRRATWPTIRSSASASIRSAPRTAASWSATVADGSASSSRPGSARRNGEVAGSGVTVLLRKRRS